MKADEKKLKRRKEEYRGCSRIKVDEEGRKGKKDYKRTKEDKRK